MPYFYYYGFDMTYLILIIPCLILSLWASARVNSTFRRYSEQLSSRGITGAQAAQRVLSANGIGNVRIERVSGNLTDHFDPKSNVIRLSDSVYNSTSTAAIGVACHEAGHAVQYAKKYGLIRLRMAIIPICNIGSQLSMPLVMLGFIFNFSILINLGIIFFILALLFQVVTLPVEFNASSRALKGIRDGNLLSGENYKGAKRVLSAAAFTYVAALLVSLAQLIRLIAIANRRRR